MHQADTVPVWDIAVRIFHWSLAISFAVAYLSGDELETLHAYAGYAVLALVLFRLAWGFIGPRHARFSDFVHPPRVIIAYLKSVLADHPRRHLGHNPAGGAMIVALLACLLISGWSGLLAYGEQGQGPLARHAPVTADQPRNAHEDEQHHEDGGREEQESAWEEIHEFSSRLALLLAAVHLFGVALSSHLHQENLVRAMITGRKQRRDEDPPG